MLAEKYPDEIKAIFAKYPVKRSAVMPLLYLAQRQAPAPLQKKICPVCGGQYEGDAEFCGSDGATLVPIN